MKYSLVLILSLLISSAVSQNIPVGNFQLNSDIGNPKKAGSSIYNKTDQSYSMKGGGYNIWFERDEFHFLFNKIKGDPISLPLFMAMDSQLCNGGRWQELR
jgi:TolB protein